MHNVTLKFMILRQISDHNTHAHYRTCGPTLSVGRHCKMAAKKEVLVVYGDRRRPIVFEPTEDPKEERIRLLEAVKVAFSDLLESDTGDGTSTDLYFQTKSDKWDGQMIDLVDNVCNGAVVHLCQESSSASKVVLTIISNYNQ